MYLQSRDNPSKRQVPIRNLSLLYYKWCASGHWQQCQFWYIYICYKLYSRTCITYRSTLCSSTFHYRRWLAAVLSASIGDCYCCCCCFHFSNFSLPWPTGQDPLQKLSPHLPQSLSWLFLSCWISWTTKYSYF